MRTLERADRTFTKALEGGNHLTRADLTQALEKSRIDTSGQRMPWILMHSEFEQVICSGGRRGSNHTYAAFDEMVPPAKSIDSSDATRELVRRYLQSHGPATVKDIQWWASLKAADVKAALAELGDEVEVREMEDIELWSMAQSEMTTTSRAVRLLETFDECIVGYTRSRFFGDARAEVANTTWRGRGMPNLVTKNGSILGHWRRTKTVEAIAIEVKTYEPLSQRDLSSLRAEARRFAAFYGRAMTLELGRV
jgi:hypothetical protein